jgi:hypothetical protein
MLWSCVLLPSHACILQATAVVHLLRSIISSLPPYKPLLPHIHTGILSHCMAARSLLSAIVLCINSLMFAPGGEWYLRPCSCTELACLCGKYWDGMCDQCSTSSQCDARLQPQRSMSGSNASRCLWKCIHMACQLLCWSARCLFELMNYLTYSDVWSLEYEPLYLSCTMCNAQDNVTRHTFSTSCHRA